MVFAGTGYGQKNSLVARFYGDVFKPTDTRHQFRTFVRCIGNASRR